jgi:hypothetical protein
LLNMATRDKVCAAHCLEFRKEGDGRT